MKNAINQLEAINKALREDAVWWAIENSDALTCGMGELETMIASSSTPFGRGYLSGILALRRSISHCPSKCSHSLALR